MQKNGIKEFILYLRIEVDREFPLQQLHVLIEIADNEGINTNDLTEKVVMQKGPLSRNIKTLSTFGEIEPGGNVTVHGKDLIEVKRDTVERRLLTYWLTDKGRNVIEHIRKIMGDCCVV